jgi:uroporphyrinogen-III synthase
MKSTIRRLSFSLIAASAVAFTPGIDPNRIVRQQSTHQSSTTTSSLSLSTSTYASDNLIPIALTREEGKNEKLLQALKKLNLPVLPVELPCIEHANGADYNQLADALHSGDWDYVAVTSPEAARVLASAWHTTKNAAQFPFAICAVGKATEQTLVDLGLAVVFTPSQAYAETL